MLYRPFCTFHGAISLSFLIFAAEIVLAAVMQNSTLFASLVRMAKYVRHAFFPPACCVCGHMVEEDECVCQHCREELPLANIGPLEDNALTRLMMGTLPIVRAGSMLRYKPESAVAELLMEVKYKHRPLLARFLGHWMGEYFMPQGMFEGVDVLVPMPLTSSRFKHRGYNQSELLALGISDVTGIPVVANLVERAEFKISQTRLTRTERRSNVEGVFRLADGVSTAFVQSGGVRHVLLVDDVITTGSSLLALGEVLNAEQVSVLSLALAGTHHRPQLTDSRILEESLEQPFETIVSFPD